MNKTGLFLKGFLRGSCYFVALSVFFFTANPATAQLPSLESLEVFKKKIEQERSELRLTDDKTEELETGLWQSFEDICRPTFTSISDYLSENGSTGASVGGTRLSLFADVSIYNFEASSRQVDCVIGTRAVYDWTPLEPTFDFEAYLGARTYLGEDNSTFFQVDINERGTASFSFGFTF